MDKIKKEIENSFFIHQKRLRDNFENLQEYCSLHYGKADYLAWIASQIDLVTENKEWIRQLVKYGAVGNAGRDNHVKPQIEQATNFLCSRLINTRIKSDYPHGESMAVLEILKQIKDNLTIYGKFNVDNTEAEKNFRIVRVAAMLSDSIVKKIREKGGYI